MNQRTPRQKKVVNTLSVRLPPDLYNKIAEMALERGETLNSVFIEIVTKGLQRDVDDRQILQDFIFTFLPPEKMRELLYGNRENTKVTT